MSSPVQVQEDSGVLRQAYFDWQIKRNPSEKRHIESALQQVDEALYHLVDIYRFKKIDWSELGVPIGLGRRLSREVKEYLAEQRGAAASGRSSGLEELAGVASRQLEHVDEAE